MEKRLTGKVAVVTGSGGLIGGEIIRRLVREGARVAAIDIVLSDKFNRLISELAGSGGTVLAKCVDIVKSEEVAAVFTEIEQELGPIDILVNNAGIVRSGKEAFHLAKEEYWKKLIEVNLFGTMICSRQVLGGMIERKNGRIINVASIAGVSGLPGWADYAASKGGVILFSQTLAMEVGNSGVTVNCVSPGLIAEKTVEHPGTWLGRTGTPGDVAGLIAFLASPEADFITGCNYMVDGGRVLGPKNATWNQ